jgi:NAD(P)-dependent dehydrogenase (short-subunit alcohol dehydrogenase family)
MKRKTVLVTGGAQGIGKAIVHQFLVAGHGVCFMDTERSAGRATLREYGKDKRLIFVPGDVASEADVRSAVAKTVRRFGRLDMLVNNACIGSGRVPLTELTLEAWNRVLGVNLTGMFLCAKHAAPHLRKSRGLIVNIASTRASMSEANTEAYAASKGGVVALTHALAVSLAPDVRAVCLSPGWIETCAWQAGVKRRTAVYSAADRRQHPCGRVGVPEDIAAMVLHLASHGGFITGVNLTIDGGMTHKMIYV